MRRIAALVTLALVVVPAIPARADQTVVIANLAFSPSTLTASLGETVTFSNTGYAVAHTSTSDEGFWDTGTIAGGGSASVAFGSAGTFRYHCAIHASMHGVVVVPLAISPAGPVTIGTEITITLASTTVAGRTFALERKRGAGPWRTVALEPGATAFRFTPGRAGRLRFRGVSVEDGVASGYTPRALIRITAA